MITEIFTQEEQDWLVENAEKVRAMRQAVAPTPLEFRMDDEGELDEIVGDCSIHLERLGGNVWWLGVYRLGSNDRAAITLHTERAMIKATVNERMPNAPTPEIEDHRATPR